MNNDNHQTHNQLLTAVHKDIKFMREILGPITSNLLPRIAYENWGNGYKVHGYKIPGFEEYEEYEEYEECEKERRIENCKYMRKERNIKHKNRQSRAEAL